MFTEKQYNQRLRQIKIRFQILSEIEQMIPIQLEIKIEIESQ